MPLFARDSEGKKLLRKVYFFWFVLGLVWVWGGVG